MNSKLQWIAGALLGIGAVILLLMLSASLEAKAADLGGGCCADLEERISDLEAVTAQKGNRKVKLTISGQLNKALVHLDAGDYDSLSVMENSTAESYLSFRGEARLNKEWTAGFTLEVGVGGYDDSKLGYGALLDGDTDGLYVRQSNVWVDGPAGRVTLGKASQATDGIVETSVANTGVASRMLSLRPLIGPEVLEVADIFDGTRDNLVRYDSPLFAGFRISGSYSPGSDVIPGTGDVWDVAVRWAGEFAGFQAAAAVGYKDGLIIPTYLQITDIKTVSGSASVKHVATGIFVSGAYGDLNLKELGAAGSVTGWQAQGGWENKITDLGKTTIFAEYGEIDVGNAFGGDLKPTLIGGGVVQSLDAAAMDLYVSGRQYDLDALSDDKVTVILGGARIRF